MPRATTNTLSTSRSSWSERRLFVEHDAAVDEVAEQGVGDGGGLLGDLLEREVLVAALLGGGEIPVDVEGRWQSGGGVVGRRSPVTR